MEKKSVLLAFAALAQEHRLAVYRLLVEHGSSGLTAGVIGERLRLAPATLSFHLKELAQARLVAARQDGRFIWYRADFKAMNGLIAYLTANCCASAGTCDTGCTPAQTTRPVRRAPPATKRSHA